MYVHRQVNLMMTVQVYVLQLCILFVFVLRFRRNLRYVANPGAIILSVRCWQTNAFSVRSLSRRRCCVNSFLMLNELDDCKLSRKHILVRSICGGRER